MTRARTWVLGFALAVAGAAAAQEGDVEVAAGLGAEHTYLGERVDYTVEVRNVTDAPDPDLSAYTAFDVELVDRSSGPYAHFVNGRGVSYTSIRFQYALTPRESGTLTVPPAIVRIDGREYRGPELTLTVAPPAPSDLVFLRTKVERTGTLPLQSFTVTLQVFVQKLPAPYSEQDPVESMSPPRLNVPWVDVPEGLASNPEDRWLAPMRARFDGRASRGFAINDLRFGAASLLGPINLFGPRGPEVFDLGGRPATDADVAGVPELEGRSGDLFVYTLNRRFVPQRPGTFTFGAPNVKGDFIYGARGTRPLTRSVFTAGNGVAVDVEDAPLEGRPATFSGAFGRDYTVTADVQPRRGRVGDPLTLTIEVAGVGNVGALLAPPLAEFPAVADKFQVETPTEDRTGANPIFTYSIRARSAEVDEFPPISFSYFDLESTSYKQVASESVPLVIDDIDSLGAGDVMKFDRGADRQAELARAEGLFGNVNDPRELEHDAIDARLVFATPPALAVLYGLTALWLGRRRRYRSDEARQRRRSAAERARDRVRHAAGALARGEADAGATGLRTALVGLVADAMDLPPGGLTARETAARLEEAGVDAALTAKVRSTLEAIDGLRYGGAASTLGAESAAVLDEVIAALRRLGRLR